MAQNSQDAIKFFRNKERAKALIAADIARKRGIIHGARAINAQVPKYLRKSTEDFDVFSPNPKRSAHRVERKLDRTFEGDFFRTKRGKDGSVETYKVVSNVNDQSVADFTKPKKIIPTRIIRGQRFATLKHQADRSRQILNDPALEFRHKKERDALLRIQTAKAIKKERRLFPNLFTF